MLMLLVFLWYLPVFLTNSTLAGREVRWLPISWKKTFTMKENLVSGYFLTIIYWYYIFIHWKLCQIHFLHTISKSRHAFQVGKQSKPFCSSQYFFCLVKKASGNSRLTNRTLLFCMFLHISVESHQYVTVKSIHFPLDKHICNHHVHHITGETDKIIVKDQYMIIYFVRYQHECIQSIKLSGWLWRMVCVL